MSQFFPKQSYALETQTPLATTPMSRFWGCLQRTIGSSHGPYSDKSLMRNAVIYELGDQLGRYTTRRRYCELYINGNYRGVYMLMENIKRDLNRVNIANLQPLRHLRQRAHRQVHYESGRVSSEILRQGGLRHFRRWATRRR